MSCTVISKTKDGGKVRREGKFGGGGGRGTWGERGKAGWGRERERERERREFVREWGAGKESRCRPTW